MIEFKRYPHVKELLLHYAKQLGAEDVERILEVGVDSSADAEHLAKFVWVMADRMAVDSRTKTPAMGRADNSDMLPDVNYEVGLYLTRRGYADIWVRVCDES